MATLASMIFKGHEFPYRVGGIHTPIYDPGIVRVWKVCVSDKHSMESEQCYDVYLNFRGKTRYGFAGTLCNALREKRFRTFMNDEGMQSGSQVSNFLLEAIEQSRISIVVFSKDYACYTWCLEELVKIVECMETRKQLVIPVSYKVAPYNVREQKKVYGEAFARHENKFGKDSEKVRKWRSALSQVAKLPGVFVGSGSGYEHEHIQKIVEKVNQSLPRYDIFLSFRGVDTRYSFTGFLYYALCREGFKTFMDDKELEGGDKISSSLIKAIEASRLSIVVLSENYAQSQSCLEELVTILECTKKKNQLVWPIFYKVEPTTVRNQKNSYGKAMTAHAERYGNDSDKLLNWRRALFEVADLKGFSLEPNRSVYEFQLIEQIVKEAIDNDNGTYSRISSPKFSQPISNDNENEFSNSNSSSNQNIINKDIEDCISISNPSWNQIINDDEDCSSTSIPT
ncbi:unnamed protein product [Sphenostylis stenocarpa]|uniref:TIR domain-containing protein n=1 Tax=Sphenostylis stenocarpa TaxID=92480 RepID=A0AA86VUF5_9FABA|nr:unnamed protein product [Sphenostylis stenocarpa]